ADRPWDSEAGGMYAAADFASHEAGRGRLRSVSGKWDYADCGRTSRPRVPRNGTGPDLRRCRHSSLASLYRKMRGSRWRRPGFRSRGTGASGMKLRASPPRVGDLLDTRRGSILDPAIERLHRERQQVEILDEVIHEEGRIFPMVAKAYMPAMRAEVRPDGSLSPVLVVRF